MYNSNTDSLGLILDVEFFFSLGHCSGALWVLTSHQYTLHYTLTLVYLKAQCHSLGCEGLTEHYYSRHLPRELGTVPALLHTDCSSFALYTLYIIPCPRMWRSGAALALLNVILLPFSHGPERMRLGLGRGELKLLLWEENGAPPTMSKRSKRVLIVKWHRHSLYQVWVRCKSRVPLFPSVAGSSWRYWPGCSWHVLPHQLLSYSPHLRHSPEQ